TGKRVKEGSYRSPFIRDTERGITAGKYSVSRTEHVIAQRYVLARNIGLVLTAAIVETDNATVGSRSLRPVNPTAFEGQLLSGMVTCGQIGDERGDLPRRRGHD